MLQFPLHLKKEKENITNVIEHPMLQSPLH
jgi:hypothetical protein